MSSITVFLVGGEPLWRRGLTLILSQQPDFVVVGEATDGSEAMSQIERLNPDVIVVDGTRLNIFAIGRRATSHSETSVLPLTMPMQQDLGPEGLPASSPGNLSKDAEVEELLRAIRAIGFGEPDNDDTGAARYAGEIDRLSDPYESLSLNERAVLPLLAESRSYREIADRIHISHYTVQTYRQRIMRKLNLHSKTELLRFALRRGLISFFD